MTRLIVTSPMLTASQVTKVDRSVNPAEVRESNVELMRGPIDAAIAAKRAGAAVFYVGLIEHRLDATVRRRLDEEGVGYRLLPSDAAASVETTFVDRDGTELLRVRHDGVPTQNEIDRLLDAVASEVTDGARLLLVAGDLVGAKRVDFAERAVGRAWGLGVRSMLAEGGASLKQAFHTQPLGAWVPNRELRSASPPDTGVEEDDVATLARIFEDPIRLLLVHHDDGSLVAATRDGSRSLGPLDSQLRGEVVGAVAARITIDDSDLAAAAEAGFRSVTPVP